MLKAFLTIGLVQVLIMLVNVARTKALALLLGPDWIGVMAVVDKLLALLVQTASLSMPFAALRFLPQIWATDPGEAFAVLRGMRNFLLLAACATTAIGLLLTAFSPGVWGDELQDYRHVVLLAFLCLPVLTFAPFLQSAIAARLRHNASMIFSLGHTTVLAMASVLGVWWNGLGGMYALYAILGCALVVLVARRVETAPVATSEARRYDFTIALPRRIWRFSLALSSLAFVLPFAALCVHYQVLSGFGAQTAGWMAAAMGIGFSVRTLLGSASSVLLTPNVNLGGSHESRMRWVGDYHRLLACLCGLAAAPLLLFPHVVLRLLYSNEFVAAAPFVGLFVIAEVVALLSGTYQSLLIAFDDIAFHVVQNIAAQTLLLAVALQLVPSQGILGAGLAGLSAPVFLYVTTAIFLRWKHGLEVPLRSALLAAFVSIGLGLGAVVGARHPEISPVVVTGKLALYGAFLVGLVFCLTAGDRAVIWCFVRNLIVERRSSSNVGRRAAEEALDEAIEAVHSRFR